MHPMLGMLFGVSGGELILIAVIALVLFGANNIPRFWRGLEQGIKEFKKASDGFGYGFGKAAGGHFGVPVGEAITPDNQTAEFIDEPRLGWRQFTTRMKNRIILWLAQGFGAGRMPFAPGTFGSLVGLVWVAVLLIPRRFDFYVGGMLAGFALSVWVCGEAEKILHQKDPGSIVLDEIVALPLCFFGLVAMGHWNGGSMPTVADLWRWDGAIGTVRTLGVFAAFRLFDIWKPWPVRQSQCLSGGWGVTVDDLLAAGYVNLAGGLLAAFPIAFRG